jgi:ribosome biogenesis GTPase
MEQTLINEKRGKVVKGLGGLFETRVVGKDGVTRITSRAKGNLKRDEERVLIGDNVVLTEDPDTPDGIVISEILPRKNSLIRPPMANLDIIFTDFAASKPRPDLETVDKLIAIAEHSSVEPVVIVTKADLDIEEAERLRGVYRLSGITCFVTSSETGLGIDEACALTHMMVMSYADLH